MKRALLLATLILLVVGIAGAQSTIPLEKFSGGYSRNFVSKGNTYFPVVALTGTAGAQSIATKGTVFLVSGTAKQTSITTSTAEAGRLIILICASTDSLTDGSNLKLAGDFNGTADDVIALVSDGTNWVELFRSVN